MHAPFKILFYKNAQSDWPYAGFVSDAEGVAVSSFNHSNDEEEEEEEEEELPYNHSVIERLTRITKCFKVAGVYHDHMHVGRVAKSMQTEEEIGKMCDALSSDYE